MKNLKIILMAILIVFGFVSFIYAQQSAKPVQSLGSRSSGVAGHIVSVNLTAGTITVKDRLGNTETLGIDTKTKIQKIAEIDLKDMSVGDTIMAICRVESGKKIAASVTVRTPSKKK